MARCTGWPTEATASRIARRALVVAASWSIAAGAAAQPLCGPSPGPCPTLPDPKAAFLPLWQQLPDRTGWQMLVSPAFPRTWPPPDTGPADLVRYAFALRLRPGLADGAEMAAPWASSTLAADGGLVVQQLSSHLQPLGVQGVRPLRSAEIALAGREQDVAERLRAGNGQATDGLVRDFTCGWIGRQGVVAATIMPLHPGFARWLACP